MTFIHPLLLSGLLLAAVPIILHLVMRQKPKRLPFPAFRFLARKAVTNRRKLQLRHLLLLLLRMLVITLMCLALARPKIISEHFNLAGDRPVTAVIIVDTSLSMGYTVAGQTRLDEAKKLALELIDGLPTGSRFAVLDPAEFGGDWVPTAATARDRVLNREFTANAGPITDSVMSAYRLFEEATKQSGESDEPMPRLLYVFTDRTPAFWDVTRTADIIAMRDRLAEPKIQHVMIDVGVEKPANLGLSEMRLKPQVIPANRPMVIPIVVQSTGQDVETQVQCRIDGLPEVDSKPVKVAAGQSVSVNFERRNLKPGIYRAEISLATADALVADNVQHITFEVRVPRPVLVITDHAEAAKAIVAALKANFPCEVKTTADPTLRTMAPSDLAKYRGVILMSVAEPGASGLWEKLEEYVHQGGGVAIFPGGEEMKPVDYNQEGTARRLLPGQFQEILSPGDNGEVWMEYQYSHPLIAPFREYAQMPETGFSESPPRTFKYWDVAINPHGLPLLKYADKERHPAILETAFDRTKIRGKVVMFTTPFDNRRDARDMPWNDYWPDWVYLAIVNKTMQYLAGEAEDAEFNFVSGRPVPVALPPGVRPNAFTLTGPGLSPADTVVPRPDQATELRLVKPHVPGHYTLATPDRTWSFAFSINANPAEFQLVPRVPMESLKDLFPESAVVTPGQSVNLMDKLEQRAKQPLELFPWLMLLLLLFLALESYFANRFYREEPQTEVDQIGKVGP